MIAAAERTRDSWLAKAPGPEIDVNHEMMHTTFDIIAQTMLPGHEDIDVGRVERMISAYLKSTNWVVALTTVNAPRWFPYPGRWRAERELAYFRGNLLRLVADRRASRERRNDLITSLIEATEPTTQQAMSDRDVVDNLLTFISAGHETTALALTWTFYLLACYPETRQRVLTEIEEVTGGGELRAEHIGQLAYTRQVIQESMRLYPPVPSIVRTAMEDVTIGEHRIPRFSPVTIPIYAIHRHRDVWSDPDTFDPDRFRPEAVKAQHRFAYLPFAAGPRICIGMSFAMTESVAILAVLLRSVDLTLRPGHVPVPKSRLTLRPDHGMPMRVAPVGARPSPPSGRHPSAPAPSGADLG
jgi:cytochrome P450